MAGPPLAPSNNGLAGAWAVFSSVKRRVEDQDFKGGEVVAVFGEVKIDLRKAGIASGEAVIEVNAVFAGVDIRVPETWLVVLRGAGIFGAFEDKTIPPRTGSWRQAANTGHYRHRCIRRHQGR